MVRVLAFLLAVGLAVYALVDLASSDEEQRGGLPRGLWVVLIVLLPFLGPIAWVLVRRSAGSGRARPSGAPGGSPGPGRRPRGPVAPDDDPEFLWRLEQERRRRERAQGPAPQPETPDDAPPA